MEGGMGAERFELACGLAGGAADGGEFDGGLERPLAVGSQAGRSEQFGDTSERHEPHVDEAAPADIAAQVESCIGCWHDDGDGREGVFGLMITQEAFQTFLGPVRCGQHTWGIAAWFMSPLGGEFDFGTALIDEVV